MDSAVIGSNGAPDAKKAWLSASETDSSEGVDIGGAPALVTAATVTPDGLVEA